MSDYQEIKIHGVEGDKIRLFVTECHPDMTELARIVDRKGQVRKSMAKRLRRFAALLVLDHKDQENSFVEQLQFLVDVGGAPSLEDAVHRLIADVEIADLKVIGQGSDGAMHSAMVTITARSSLVFRSFRKGKSHRGVATLDGDIDLF